MRRKPEQIRDFLGEGIELTMDPELKRAFDFEDNQVPKELRNPENVRLNKESFRVSGDGVFYTIQGEGLSMGEPAVFLRLHVCNLRCVWCDAYYTWNPKSQEFWTESKQWSIGETAEKVRSEWGVDNDQIPKRLVITGGEPLLQKEQIDKLISDLGSNWFIEIETNGTIVPTEQQLQMCQFNCSPKLANSHNVRQARIRPEVIHTLIDANTMFKFVVMTDEDLDEIEQDYIQ